MGEAKGLLSVWRWHVVAGCGDQIARLLTLAAVGAGNCLGRDWVTSGRRGTERAPPKRQLLFLKLDLMQRRVTEDCRSFLHPVSLTGSCPD
jgi:hypothetical protein